VPVRLPAILRLAVVYALIGIPSLYSAIPPGYTAPVFPAAGIALMSLLLWGGVVARRAAGLLAGAAGGQLAVRRAGPGFSALLVVPCRNLAGPGRTLADYPLIGWPNRLDNAASVIRLMLLVIPLSCLAAAGISVPLLAALGVLPRSDTLFNAWNWWLGDTFGCLIMLP
jgi:integral membrane sensor domain MASE1